MVGVQTDRIRAKEKITGRVNPAKLIRVAEENDELRREIVRSRILHVMTQRAIPKYYKARMIAVDKERRSVVSQLWKSRRRFAEIFHLITSHIEESTRELTEHHFEIEKLKADLEVRRQEVVQLRHSKELSLRSTDELLQTLKPYLNRQVPETDVQVLLGKLEAAETELDELEADAEDFEIECDQQVRMPMMELDHFRRKVVQAAQTTMVQQTLPRADVVAKILALQEANGHLAQQNAELELKIQSLLVKKQEMSPAIRKSVEGLTAPPIDLHRSYMLPEKRIFRPKPSARRTLLAWRK
jgi:hypothetical protein